MIRGTPIRAVCIDLDGTLLDTIPDLAAAANRMLADLALAPLPEERIRRFVGKGAEVLIQRTLDASGVAATPDDPIHAKAIRAWRERSLDRTTA